MANSKAAGRSYLGIPPFILYGSQSLAERGNYCILHIEGQNLMDLDLGSLSDPVCFVNVWDNETSEWKEIGRTEVINNTLNPKFSKYIAIPYESETSTMLQFCLYDKDGGNKYEPLGRIETDLQLLSTTVKVRQQLKPIKKEKVRGHLSVYCYKLLDDVKEEVTATFNIPDECKRVTIEMEFTEYGEEDDWIVICDAFMPNKSPKGVITLHLPLNILGKGCYDKRLKIICWKKDIQRNFKIKICTCTTTARKIINSEPLDGDQNQVSLRDVNVCDVYQFREFVQEKRTHLKVTVGIDFSKSNKDQSQEGSIHYRTEGTLNPCETALRSVLDILQKTINVSEFDVRGFGAIIPDAVGVQHNFSVSLNDPPKIAVGVQGVVDQYKKCLNRITFDGPSFIDPLIHDTAERTDTSGREYHILVIITDGCIDDILEAKSTIVKLAGQSPLSIIIIGIGNDRILKALDILNGNKNLPVDGSTRAKRDIVHTVSFNDYKGRHNGEEFREDVLKEICDQLLNFMQDKGLTPQDIGEPSYC